jgi:hypothetical protein
MIAAVAHGLNGDHARASAWTQSIKSRARHLNRSDFLRAFPVRDAQARLRIMDMLDKLGF